MRSFALLLAISLASLVAFADTTSYTGTLQSAEDTYTTTFTLTSTGTVDLQTYGFGGGTNAASQTILAGGFDSFVGIFAGTGDGAVFVNGTSDVLSNFTPGCPPAGIVNLGGGLCGDVNLSQILSAGTYTVLLSDAEYIPAAVFESGPGTLGDGFIDGTGGVFQTYYGPGPDDYLTPTANWALDVTTPDELAVSPEPVGLWMLGLVPLAWSFLRRQQQSAL